MAGIYVKLRDGIVDGSECLNALVTAYKDGAGGLVGIEVLGAEEVTVDGVVVEPLDLVAVVRERISRARSLGDPLETAKAVQAVWEDLVECAGLVGPVRKETVRELKTKLSMTYREIGRHLGLVETAVGVLFRGKPSKGGSMSVPLRADPRQKRPEAPQS